MSKLNVASLRLLGLFALEANVGRTIALSVRVKKARGLLAYLAMQPECKAPRERLATLLWGDTTDAQARHSLRQCLNALRQDLCVASEILIADREAIGLNTKLLTVDARKLLSLGESGDWDTLSEAAELWRGPFLQDLVLDVEEFDLWRERQAQKLSVAAADVFESLGRDAAARGDSGRALAAAERLIRLEPTREDRQRTALKLIARFKGREAALSHAELFTALLRDEIGAAPEASTRLLINDIKRGMFEENGPPSLEGPQHIAAARRKTIAQEKDDETRRILEPLAAKEIRPGWRRLSTGALAASAIACILIAALGTAAWLKLSQPRSESPHNRSVAILPFVVDSPTSSGDAVYAKLLTHDVIGYLSRDGYLQVLSVPASEAYRDRNPARGDIGVQYTLVGHVVGDDRTLRMEFQLVDTGTQTNVWSDNLQRDRGEPTGIADESARGIARMVAYEIDHLAALRLSGKPKLELTPTELVGLGYLAMERGATKENLNTALSAFTEALRRNPHYVPAVLAVARVQVVAGSNFVDLTPPPDLNVTERLINATLSKFPNSITALYSLAILQKHRRQYEASMRTLQRCLEINPSFLPAQGQMAHILTRSGQPQEGLELIRQTLRSATANDPSAGYWYLFAAEAELDLGHGQAALDWALRADTFMPGSPLVQAWLASIYTTTGDKANAAKYAAALRRMAPDRTRAFLTSKAAGGSVDRNRPPILDGLRLALGSAL